MSKEDNSGCGPIILVLAGIGIGIYLINRLIIFAVVLFVLWGYNSIFFLDNLFSINPFNPIAMWGVWGLFFGSIVGVFVAVKKFKLSKILILYPIALVALLVTIMSFVNNPGKFSGNYSPPGKELDTPTQKNYYVLNSNANMRSGPSTDYSILFVLKNGYEVEVIQGGFYDTRNIEWYKIKDNGQEGYISSKLLNYSRIGY